MTYRQLLEQLNNLAESQLDCELTVELGPEDECYPAIFRIAGGEHDSLDENHPIIFVE